jgi:hypothetical protein
MSKSSSECVYCGYVESEHGPRRSAACQSYEPVLGPRVYVSRPGDEEGKGRAGSTTHDPARDYVVLEVPDEDWTVAYLLTVQSGSLVVAEVRVYPTEPAMEAKPGEWSRDPNRVPKGGVTGRRLRQVGVTEHHRHTEQIIEELRMKMGDEAFETLMAERGFSDHQVSILATAEGLSKDRATRLAQIAALYVAAVSNGERSPVARVAEQLGMVRSSIRDQLHDARTMGLLEGSSVGVARGSLTTKARKLLDEVTKERKQ